MGMDKHSQNSKNRKFAMPLKEVREMKLIFRMQINIKTSYKLISMAWSSKFP